jgi:hypothetical protein
MSIEGIKQQVIAAYTKGIEMMQQGSAKVKEYNTPTNRTIAAIAAAAVTGGLYATGRLDGMISNGGILANRVDSALGGYPSTMIGKVIEGGQAIDDLSGNKISTTFSNAVTYLSSHFNVKTV